jgi:hypothetical protein
MGDQTADQNTARYVLERAAALVSGDRAADHGPARKTHQNIADLWNTYLGYKGTDIELRPSDVAMMMVLLKVARTMTGRFNPDDYVDMAGYAGLALECSPRSKAMAASMAPPVVRAVADADAAVDKATRHYMDAGKYTL